MTPETSREYKPFRVLGKEVRREIPASQMQYNADYNGTDREYQCILYLIDNVEKIKFRGIKITNDLKWNTNVSNIYIHTNRTLGFLRRIQATYPKDVKESVYSIIGPRRYFCCGSSVLHVMSVCIWS